MTNSKFLRDVTDLYYGWSDVALLTYKVGKRNVAVYYSATNDGDALQPIKKPPYLIRVTTLGRYPQLVKSERMPTLKDALHWLIEEFRPEYQKRIPVMSDEELEEELLLAEMELEKEI